jgi:dUTP pyrophosphatase
VEDIEIPSMQDIIMANVYNDMLPTLMKYANLGDRYEDLMEEAGVDYSNVPSKNWAMVGTGVSFEIPEGYEIQIRSRSGLAAKEGLFVLNSPGTIDADYRGEIKVILINHSKEDFTVTHGMRIAQMVIAKYEHVTLEEVDSLEETQRGTNGFGSTGR